ncbi:hypothetical protein SAMN05443144_108109 [Fodinibius roseus]|uniref:Uncharacterized protein n=1 Tax=Fodinibius roseus TaxID=1194090 RepID=A0A1M5BFV1_9BACT|nr:hypothetical protein SAMN05443144_108109 [Fodinibius roseus]
MFRDKARGTVESQHMTHMWAFQPSDNADFG